MNTSQYPWSQDSFAYTKNQNCSQSDPMTYTDDLIYNVWKFAGYFWSVIAIVDNSNLLLYLDLKKELKIIQTVSIYWNMLLWRCSSVLTTGVTQIMNDQGFIYCSVFFLGKFSLLSLKFPIPHPSIISLSSPKHN